MSASPAPAERDAVFKTFGRAFLKQDLDLMYQAVTVDFEWRIHDGDDVRRLNTRAAIERHFADRAGKTENVRFHDVVYHHAPDASFMTFRITGTDKATGRAFAREGVERYTFRDGKLALKDVYLKPASA